MNFKTAIFSFTLIAISWLTHAQPYTSDLGRFEVDQKKGCAPLTVNVTIKPPSVCNGASGCDMDYENNGGFRQNIFSYTYSQPGTYTLRILFQTGGFDQITIVVTPNTQPAFEIYSCGGNETQVKVTDTNYNQYIINYNDGSPDVLVPSGSLAKDNHVFATSGNKTITVRGRNLSADDNCNPANQSVNAIAVLPAPTISQLAVLDNARIQLDFINQPTILYKLEISTNSTNFQQLQNIYNTNTTIITNLRPDDNYYCFRLGAFDPCNNTTLFSNIICSANFDLNALSDINRLTWTTEQNGISDYAISKSNGAPYVIPAPSSTLDDTNIICGTDYCYQLTSNYFNGSRSISLLKCDTAFSTKIPTPVENISTNVVDNSRVDMQWTQDPAFTTSTYSITKSGVAVGTSPVSSFTDATYSTSTGGCYRISYIDACNNKSPASIEACPVTLSGTLQPNNIINLSWTPYGGWKNGVDHYVVEKFSEQGQLLQTFDTGLATVLTDNEEDFVNQVYLYRVTVFAVEAGIVNSTSNTITVIKEPNLFHPSSFTPNSDGLNDIFKVFGQFTAQVEFKIFNRWGEMLFITNDLDQGWDGTYKNNAMPEGTYVFRAKLTDQAGRTSDRSGTILLLRKRP